MRWPSLLAASLLISMGVAGRAEAGGHNYCTSSNCTAYDSDNDGWGDCDDASAVCSAVLTTPVGDCADDPEERPDGCTTNEKSIHPGATETCDSCDNDCDGTVDEANASGCTDFYYDNDGDGYGDSSIPSVCLCDAEGKYRASKSGDEGCDADGQAGINPGVAEVCDEIDNNCNGTTDEFVTTLYYKDADHDGYSATTGESKAACEPDDTYRLTTGTNNDCDDGNAAVHPDAGEVTCDGVDNDCSAATVDGSEDNDHDSYSSCTNDCDDADSSRNPGQTEDCATPLDDNCDGLTDAIDALHCSYYYEDSDSDGYGKITSKACLCGASIPFLIEGTTSLTADCNDDDTSADALLLGGAANIHPGALDDCDASYGVEGDQIDADCDGDTVEVGAVGCLDFAVDEDGDHYGDPETTECTCYAEPGFGLIGVDLVDDTDCDDTTADRAPSNPEVCDEPYGIPQVDNDCDGDPNSQLNGDGTVTYVESDEPASSCEDTGCTDLAAYPYYRDEDGDGYGAGDPVYLCGEPLTDFTDLDGSDRTIFAASGGDCADDSREVHPQADELCNNRDDDCDLNVDEPEDLGVSSGCVDMHPDRDLDGYGDEATDSTVCLCYTASLVDEHAADCTPLEGSPGQDADGTYYYYYDGVCWTLDDTDCYDYAQDIRPGAPEALDGDDTNCDDDVLLAELDCDDDGSFALAPPAGDGVDEPTPASLDLHDCADGTDTILTCWGGVDVRATCGSAALMVVDRTDEALADHFDGGKRQWPDGTATTTPGDCDDLCASRYPGAAESCDGLDNDCSSSRDSRAADDEDGIPDAMDVEAARLGTVSGSEMDLDGDGYLSCSDIPDSDQAYVVRTTCDDAASFEGRVDDCNDLCFDASPAVTDEVCDGFLDVCGGEAEGTDVDGDGYRTCGVFGTGDAADLADHVYVLVWYDRIARGEDSADAADPEIVPLVAPRPDALDACDATLTTRLSEEIGATRLQAVLDAQAAVADPSVVRASEVAAVIEPMLQACICADVCARDADACPESCGTVSGSCGLARITLDAESDAGIDTRSLSTGVMDALGTCLDHPDQLAWRTEWSRERILQSRRLVQEWHCYSLDGSYGCGDLDGDMGLDFPTYDSATPGGNVTSTLTQAPLEADEWWPLLGRFSPEPVREGLFAGCWGDPRSGVEHTTMMTGGDCDDASTAANRGLPEGPSDILVPWIGGGACDVCVDGIDNNCDSRIDCEDPTCAPCFVGVGAGCGDPDAPCDASGGCRTGPAAPLGAAAALASFLVGALRSRRISR